MSDSRDVVTDVILDVRNSILEFCEVNSCIETTRLTVMTLTELGFNVREQAVKVAVQNSESYRLMQSGIPYPQWPDSAWNLAVGFQQGDGGEKGWNGHLVAILRRSGEKRLLLDVSADQFNRPGKLNVPGPITMTMLDLWTPQDPQNRILADGDTIVTYYPFAPQDPVGKAYLTTPAWNDNSDDFERGSKAIADQYRDRMVA